MRTGSIARSIAASGVALVALTACGGGGDSGNGSGSENSGQKQVNLYGTDGNIGNPLGEEFSDASELTGLKGTTPLTKLQPDFTDRLLKVDPKLVDYNYAGESYDAVVITALAAAMAQSNDATKFAPYVNGVTFGGDKCTDYKSCIDIISKGGTPDYDGIIGPLDFSDPGESAVASYGVLQFNDKNQAVPKDYLVVGDEENAAKSEGPAPAPYGSGSGPL